jgi:hypothetical protein
MSAVHIYQPGTILLLSEGEYSDFGYCGQLVTLKTCHLADLIDAYRAARTLENPDIHQGPSDFVAWLITTEHAAPLQYSEAHLGDYGELRLG